MGAFGAGNATPYETGFNDADYQPMEDMPHPDCRCDGNGIIITCPDDVCRGAGHCRHGDGMKLCPCGAL